MRTFEVLVFDLDDTLIDTSHLLVPAALKDVCQVLQGYDISVSYDTCLNEKRQRTHLHEEFLPYFVEKHTPNMPKTLKREILDKCNQAFYSRDIKEKLSISPSVKSWLKDLSTSYTLYLVTAGSQKTQKQKIKILELAPLFQHIFYVDEWVLFDKSTAFKAIFELENIESCKILSIGNRLDTDIAQAKKLGFSTCYINYGEYQNSQPKNDLEKPDFTFSSVIELKPLLEVHHLC